MFVQMIVQMIFIKGTMTKNLYRTINAKKLEDEGRYSGRFLYSLFFAFIVFPQHTFNNLF